MRISDPIQLCTGMELFYVDGFGQSRHECRITKVGVVDVAISSDHKPEGPKVWIRVEPLFIYGDITSLNLVNGEWEESDSFKTWIGKTVVNSMQDMGIIQNTYNKHQAFTTLDDAKLYGKGKLLGYFDVAPSVGFVGDYERAMKVI